MQHRRSVWAPAFVVGISTLFTWQVVGQDLDEPIEIKPGTALAQLISEMEDIGTIGDVAVMRAAANSVPARRFRSDLPDWLLAHYRRNHSPSRVLSQADSPDPTGGFPLALESLYTWMLLHQDLKPDDSPALKSATTIVVEGNTRISGNHAKPRSESDIRINPNSPNLIIAASNNLGGSQQAQFFSSDGGVTWGQTLLPLQPGDSHHTDPTVDWSSDGTAWATTIGVDAGTAGLQMRAYRSTDGGQTWEFDAAFSGEQNSADKQLMWIDRSSTSPFKDSIYVIWHNNRPVFVNRRLPGDGPDKGWQVPQRLSGAETTGTGIGGDITTNAAGELFAVWPDTGSRNIFVRKSADGAAQFTAAVTIARTNVAFDIGIPAFARRRLLIYASVAAFRDSTRDDVYVSWSDLAGGAGCRTSVNEPGNDVNSACTTRVFFAKSTDGGASWKAAVKVGDSTEKVDQFNQRLAIDPKSGNLGIIYAQSGNGADRTKSDIFFQASIDRGDTWSRAVKVTTAPTDETTVQADLGNQYGDYNGLSVVDGDFFPCWTDRSDGKAESIFTAKISLRVGASGALETLINPKPDEP